MAAKTATITMRCDYARAWQFYNPVLDAGEPGFDFDNLNLKVGDGVTHWNDLKFITEASA